jgi:hypothetical protein
MATQQRSKTKKFIVVWKANGGSEEVFGHDIDDALRQAGLSGAKGAIEYSTEIPMTPEEDKEYASSDDWENYFGED